jgi:hypothetical protein
MRCVLVVSVEPEPQADGAPSSLMAPHWTRWRPIRFDGVVDAAEETHARVRLFSIMLSPCAVLLWHRDSVWTNASQAKLRTYCFPGGC